MNIYKTAVKRPIATIVLFIGLIAIGIYSLQRLPIDLYPEIEPMMISVSTTYEGASAADIESNITRPLEDNLTTLTNLKDITSESRDNVSSITLEFDWGTNLDEASNEIRDVIGRIGAFLPEDADDPIIFKFSTDMIPVMMMAVTADESYQALGKIIDDQIINRLNRIEGVGNVFMVGEPEREIQVNIDPRKLEAYNISLEHIGNVIRSENLDYPVGNIKMGQTDYPLRYTGEFQESYEINNIVVANRAGSPVYMRDIAEVKDTLREKVVIERVNREEGLRFFVQRQSGANAVEIANSVNEIIPELEKGLPPDITIIPIFDTSEFIVDSIDNLTDVLIYAAVFVVLVVLLFLGKWRATFIIFLTIPVSLITAFIYLDISGNTLNIISLSSLAIAMGMVVDDAIVVLENITKHFERGSLAREASIFGTNEVAQPVIASTLTVIAVFFPMTLITGLMGIFFNQLGYIVVITVSVSTIAALSLTPMLSSKFLGKRTKKSGLGPKLSKALTGFFDFIDNVYTAILRWALKNKWKVVVLSGLLFFASLFSLLIIGTSFFPETDENQVRAEIELPMGYRIEEGSKIASDIEDIIEDKYPEVDRYSVSVGDAGGFFGGGGGTSNIINIRMGLVESRERERDAFEIAELLRRDIGEFPEVVNYTVEARGGGGGGMGMGAPIQVEIYGDDFDVTNRLASELSERMEGIEGIRNIDISRGEDRPELRIVPDQEKLASFGLNTATVSNAVRNRIDGMTATFFREEGDEYDVVVRYKEPFRESIACIENIVVENPMGQNVRLKEVASVVEHFSPPNIERKNRVRYLTVSASLFQRSLGDATSDIQGELDDMDIPGDVFVEFGGDIEDQREAFADLLLLLALGIFLVYVVMAAQFESFRTPFIIMLAIPFAFTGVMIALLLTGTELSVISAVGGIILVGIVVKNSIVLIDYTNLMNNRGLTVIKSVLRAGKSRLRPVLMTTVTTVLAMIPLALSQREGSEIWQPMAIAVIGGLTFSTLITLVFVPATYTIFGRARIKKQRRIFHKKLLKGDV